MAGDTVLVPGARTVEGTLDGPDDADTLVVACPPHPQFGGNRSNRLLVAVSEYLADEGIATLRFDYGDWDHGRGEREDVRNAVRWAADRYDAVGVFGYSFGGAMAALAASSVEVPLCAVSLLAPASQVTEFDPAATVEGIDAPLQVVFGTRDDTAAWEVIAEAAREVGADVAEIQGDHFFVGQQAAVARTVGGHFVDHC
jgi:hypothetical protein